MCPHNFQYTFNALAGTNKLNQSSLNTIDCGKLQHWESIAIQHISMWPERFWNEQYVSVDGCVVNDAALSWAKPEFKTDLNIQTPAILLLIQCRNTHRVRDFCLVFCSHCSQLILLIWAKCPIFQMKLVRSYERRCCCFCNVQQKVLIQGEWELKQGLDMVYQPFIPSQTFCPTEGRRVMQV